MEKPPPLANPGVPRVEILAVDRLNGPNDVPTGSIIEKSPVPWPEVCESPAVNIVAVGKLGALVETKNPAKGMSPWIPSACKMVALAIISANRNRKRVEARSFMVVYPPRESAMRQGYGVNV
jgi:hypothetical protein